MDDTLVWKTTVASLVCMLSTNEVYTHVQLPGAVYTHLWWFLLRFVFVRDLVVVIVFIVVISFLRTKGDGTNAAFQYQDLVSRTVLCVRARRAWAEVGGMGGTPRHPPRLLLALLPSPLSVHVCRGQHSTPQFAASTSAQNRSQSDR